MLGRPLISLVVLAALQQVQVTIVQQSSGWCSPNIANVNGNVTVNCIGVDPRALRTLNEQFRRKNLQLKDLVSEANRWAEQYHELERRLADAGDNAELSHQAEEYLHQGDLKKAEEILKQILPEDEKNVDRSAADHYNLALAFELEFRPVDALPHLAKAYQYRPDNPYYAREYGKMLQDVGRYEDAKRVLDSALTKLEELSHGEPSKYELEIVLTLNRRGALFMRMARFDDAEGDFTRAIKSSEHLGLPESQKYWLATMVNNEAAIHCEEGKLQECESEYRESEKIFTGLNAPYEKAGAWHNLGVVYTKLERFEEAEQNFQRALWYRQLFAMAGASSRVELAATLNGLGKLYYGIALIRGDKSKLADSEAMLTRAAQIMSEVAKSAGTEDYQSIVAETTQNLALVYCQEPKPLDAHKRFDEVLQIRRRQAESDVTGVEYAGALGESLEEAGTCYFLLREMPNAVKATEDAVAVLRPLWLKDQRFGHDLSLALLQLAHLMRATGQEQSKFCALVDEARKVESSAALTRIGLLPFLGCT